MRDTWHDAHVAQPESERARGASHRVVRVLTADEERWSGDTVCPRIGQQGRARGEERGECGFAPAGGERAAGIGPVARERGQPADDLVFDDRRDRGHLPDGDRLIEGGGEGFRPDGSRERCRHLVPDIARVVEVIGVRQDLIAQAGDDLADRASPERERLGEAGGEFRAGVRRRDAARGVAGRGQVLYGERRECVGDIGAAVGVERREDIGRHDAIK